jgi:acylpyruvate hydrolase
MKFASIEYEGRPLAVLVEDAVGIPLDGVTELGLDTPSSLLTDPPLRRGEEIPLAEARLRPVVPSPRKVLCVGLNYWAHIEECEQETPSFPVLFSKYARSLIGAHDPIALPPESERVDYEAELVVIIGAEARRVTEAEALSVVGGYAVGNDTTMRDYQFKTHQWLPGKAWDAASPVGPYLVTPDEVGDPGRLSIRLTVNGEIRQESSTELMMFGVARLVSAISEFITLEPGDMIFTGTPSGVGDRRDPPVYLGAGDVVQAEIPGVGAIENTIVPEAEIAASAGQAAAAR